MPGLTVNYCYSVLNTWKEMHTLANCSCSSWVSTVEILRSWCHFSAIIIVEKRSLSDNDFPNRGHISRETNGFSLRKIAISLDFRKRWMTYYAASYNCSWRYPNRSQSEHYLLEQWSDIIWNLPTTFLKYQSFDRKWLPHIIACPLAGSINKRAKWFWTCCDYYR